MKATGRMRWPAPLGSTDAIKALYDTWKAENCGANDVVDDEVAEEEDLADPAAPSPDSLDTIS
ncbi:Uu.00g044680.m01.CDS01 [Anthostomella pinea]|uniref:Uu.00g044680.m01.CDS01 n=1 Tax=Anthostomella pinea TaxID=933095 RepID=A0AAI8YEB5_9PEZI|nr:Uu.00g044680.m01.CDS01 [Anthostomella pinea]